MAAVTQVRILVTAWTKLFVLFLKLKNLTKTASAGNRTRINCLEGSYADHYTTDADKNNLYKFVDHNKIKGAITQFVKS